MCGRFTNRLTWCEIVALYRLSGSGNAERNRVAAYKLLFPAHCLPCAHPLLRKPAAIPLMQR
jgi:hypothetical protein